MKYKIYRRMKMLMWCKVFFKKEGIVQRAHLRTGITSIQKTRSIRIHLVISGPTSRSTSNTKKEVLRVNVEF